MRINELTVSIYYGDSGVKTRSNIIITNTNNNNKYVYSQYSMQFSGPPRKIAHTHVQHRFAQANGGSTNTTKVHALLLPSEH